MAGDFIHWNINGIKCKKSPNFKDKINTLSSILENSSSTEILNIQETHISHKEELPKALKLYEHLYSFVITYASNDDPYSGILLAINKNEEIISSESVVKGRLLFIKIQNKASKEITNIVSIYCNPSNSEKQKNLILKAKAKIMQNPGNYIILGDFNFVTSILDRNSNRLNSYDSETKSIWEDFENDCNVQDSFRLTNPTRRLYTYSSKSNKKSRSRIDRVYISSSMAGRVISSVFTTNVLSDHKIVKVKIAKSVDKGPGMWIFNDTLLKDDAYYRSIKTIIQESSSDIESFPGDLKFCWDIWRQKVLSFTKEYSKAKARSLKREINENKIELEKLESLHPQKLNIGILDKIDQLKKKINDFEKNKIRGALLRSKIPNFEENEPNIHFLNALEKRKGEENTIYNIMDNESETMKYGTKDINETIFNYYSKLYKKEKEDEFEQNEFLKCLELKLSAEDREFLEKDFSESELYEALCSLNDGKSPGADGLTKSFYLHFWDDIKSFYMECIKEIKTTKDLTEMQKRGAIKILFKDGERFLIKNYRPITLLNTDLKIITKALAKRLSIILPKLIHRNQTCVPGRNIENNIHLVQNLIDHINANNEELAIIFVDQEKAFDRMSHSFIFKTLEKFGFGKNFIDWVKIICNGTKSFVKVNGYETNEFNIERGVRQGCPLSGLLYVLTAEVLSTHIRKNKNIKGYKYKMKNLEYLEHKIVQHADDTNVCVSTIKSIEELFKTFDKFERATNAKINKDKTKALWIGKWKNRVDKPMGLKWTNISAKFLGIHVGNKIGASGSKLLAELNFAEQIEKIKNKMKYWKGKGISLIGRVKVANIFLLSRFWYRTKCLNITNHQLQLLEKMVRNFIWNDKIGGRVRQGVLQLEFNKGGLQLVDIVCKIKTQRVQRIMFLLSLDRDNIERFLADSLIGCCQKFGQNGLSYGLFSNVNRIKLVKHDFYREALEIVNKLEITMIPGSLRSIENEPLFYNKLFLDNNNAIFKLARFKKQMPIIVKDLQKQTISKEITVINKVREIKECLRTLATSGKTDNDFIIESEGQKYNINNLKFKEIYKIILNKKGKNREWEGKWADTLQTIDLNWDRIWTNINNNIHNNYVKSAIWEMIHLNFWSGFKANERCKLCNEVEESTTHIINKCKILKYIIGVFCINEKFDNEIKISFGLDNELVNNFILFHIKSVVFRARFQTFTNLEACKSILTKKCKKNIGKDLWNKFKIAKAKGIASTFLDLFLPYSNGINNFASILDNSN